MSKPMTETDIRIRIADEGITFIYSVYRAGEVLETAEVHPLGAPLALAREVEVVPAYYGGSEVMD